MKLQDQGIYAEHDMGMFWLMFRSHSVKAVYEFDQDLDQMIKRAIKRSSMITTLLINLETQVDADLNGTLDDLLVTEQDQEEV